ncbi:hypothetical protein [Streptomyces sp. NPDC090135]|uniref:hypothetical protein n=1 Tax=Streptomyces sp. NPDC090135 TaxID=3365957 RepID=UPI0037F3A456
MDLTIIRHAVEVDHGIKRVSMGFLKRHAAKERARLSADLCTQIAAELGRLGLGTIPRTLPTSENEYVWVILKDSPLGEIADVGAAVALLDEMDMNPIPKLFDQYPNAKSHLR